jgi:hypothetical protein
VICHFLSLDSSSYLHQLILQDPFQCLWFLRRGLYNLEFNIHFMFLQYTIANQDSVWPCQSNATIEGTYEGVFESFRTDRLER